MAIQVTRRILRLVYRQRPAWCHKYDYGHLLIVGGSERYSGSPAFNALAALRAGVDLVAIVAPQRAADIAASFAPDLIAYPLKGAALMPRHVALILRESARCSALVIGGGLGRDAATRRAALQVIQQAELPMVVDADALRFVATAPQVLRNKLAVLTPHSDEFRDLSGAAPPDEVRGRCRVVRELARRLGVVVLLKGEVAVISNGLVVAVSRVGSRALTKGGVGDALAGVCGAYLARGVEPFTAACAAAYVNGLAGALAASRLGEGMFASDLIAAIPQALARARIPRPFTCIT